MKTKVKVVEVTPGDRFEFGECEYVRTSLENEKNREVACRRIFEGRWVLDWFQYDTLVTY